MAILVLDLFSQEVLCYTESKIVILSEDLLLKLPSHQQRKKLFKDKEKNQGTTVVMNHYGNNFNVMPLVTPCGQR